MTKVTNTGRYQYYYDDTVTEEERNKRKAEWARIKDKNDTISIKLSGNGDSVSGCFMRDFLQYDIKTGIAKDIKNDGFSQTDKITLAAEIEKIFKEHGYSTDFKHMLQYDATKSTNGNGMYEITYDDYIRLMKAAGYEFDKINHTISEKLPKVKEISDSILSNTSAILMKEDNIKTNSVTDTSTEVISETGRMTEEDFLSIFESDETLKNKTNEERLKIIEHQIFSLKQEKNAIEKPTYTYIKTGFLGLGKKIQKEVTLTEEEQAVKTEKIKIIQTNLDKAEKIRVYLKALTAEYWSGNTLSTVEGKNTDGTIFSYPKVQKVIYEYPDGRKIHALREDIYRQFQHKYKYYPISADKVSNNYEKNYTTFYRIVPDLEHELPPMQNDK